MKTFLLCMIFWLILKINLILSFDVLEDENIIDNEEIIYKPYRVEYKKCDLENYMYFFTILGVSNKEFSYFNFNVSLENMNTTFLCDNKIIKLTEFNKDNKFIVKCKIPILDYPIINEDLIIKDIIPPYENITFKDIKLFIQSYGNLEKNFTCQYSEDDTDYIKMKNNNIKDSGCVEFKKAFSFEVISNLETDIDLKFNINVLLNLTKTEIASCRLPKFKKDIKNNFVYCTVNSSDYKLIRLISQNSIIDSTNTYEFKFLANNCDSNISSCSKPYSFNNFNKINFYLIFILFIILL